MQKQMVRDHTIEFEWNCPYHKNREDLKHSILTESELLHLEDFTINVCYF
jgi:hypothetical protein